MMSLLRCVRKQLPESEGSYEATLEKGYTNPLDVTLEDIAENLLSFLNGFNSLQNAKNVIEKKYEIKKEYGDCWSAGDIRRVWGQTQRMDVKSNRRRNWSHVIILQILKRFMAYDGCKPNAAHNNTTNENKQSCETRPEMKGSSEAVLETAGVEQMFGEVISEVSKLSDYSGVGSGSQLSSSSTDEDPSPAEVNPVANSVNTKTKNAALNEDEDDSNDQQSDVDDYESYVEDPHDLENETWEDDLWSAADTNQACGKAEIMEGNSEDRSSHDELETVEAAGEARWSSGANSKSSKSGLNQTAKGSQGQSGKQRSAGSQGTKNGPGAPGGRSSSGLNKASEQTAAVKKPAVNNTIYIRIPFTEMFGNRRGVSQCITNSRYKLLDGFPSNIEIRKRKSYIMSFNNQTNNAEWVYEILNRETLERKFVETETFGGGYDRGHLAAAANHKWCWEAYNDANLYSNIIPQNSRLNQVMWRLLEKRCRHKIYGINVRNVHVYTGPLYSGTEIKSLKGKRVPDSLFKVSIVENEDGTIQEPECYVVPNKTPEEEDTLDSFKKDIKHIQEISELIFTQHSTNTEEKTKEVELKGKDLNEEPCNANIRVTISENSQ